MAGIIPDTVVQRRLPKDVWGICIKPEITVGETMREAAASVGASFDSVYVDSALDRLMLKPSFAHIDQQTGVTNFWNLVPGSTGALRTEKNRTIGKDVASQYAAVLNTEWSCNEAGGTSTFCNPWSGEWLSIWRSSPLRGAPMTPSTTYVAFDITTAGGSFNNQSYVSGRLTIRWPFGETPYVTLTGYAANGFEIMTWHLGRIPVPQSNEWSGCPASLTLQIMRIDNRLLIRAGQGGGDWNDRALIIDDVELQFPVKMRGRNFNAQWAASPMTFPTWGKFTSADKMRPWLNTTAAVCSFDPPLVDPMTRQPIYYVLGQTVANVAMNSLKDSNVAYMQYQLVLTGNGYYTPAVLQTRMQVPSVRYAPSRDSSGSSWGDDSALPYVESVRISHFFNPQELSHNSSAEIDFHNTRLESTSLIDGMRAYRILGRVAGVWGDGWGGYPSKWYKEHDPASDCYVRFEGWGGMRVSGDMKRLTVYCMDRSYQLRRVMMYNPPYFDGWCVYYAIKSLLQRGGIDVVDLGLMPNQPSDSWTCDGFTCDHPRMRRGTGENPLMRFPQGTSVWQAMQEIRRLYSFALGFIRNKFYFYPWEPWQAREEFVASRTFDAVPIFTGGVPDLNEFIDDVFVSRDLSDTRTGMTLVGLNKDDWQPISAHRFDPAATGVDNEGVPLGNRTYLPINFKGFHDEYVESSAMFVDKEFLNYATDRIWNIMRFPRHRERLRVWWQPIDPLDYVSIGPHRMRTSEEYEKFYVASVIEDINPESATCTIECELLPYQTQDAQNHQGDTMEIIVPPEISDSGGVYNSTEVSLSEDEDAKIPYAIADQSAADQSVAI